MPDHGHDTETRLHAALEAMRVPPTLPPGAADRMAATAVLAAAPRARQVVWGRRVAAVLTAAAIGGGAFVAARRASEPAALATTAGAGAVTLPDGMTITPIASTPVRPIVFEFEAPEAHSVQVLGDFNEWSRDAIAMQRGPDGRWRITTLLKPGRYVYAYLIDGERFARDPQRDAVEDRDFGVPGSELVVGEAP